MTDRLVSSNKGSCEGDCSTFCIRTGTSKGVVNRVFRVECERDLASWARGLVTGTHNCVVTVREAAWGTCAWRRSVSLSIHVPFVCLVIFLSTLYILLLYIFYLDCLWRGQEARLFLHYEDGLKLYPASESHYGENKTAAQPLPFWTASFGNLRHSADDGVRILWLDIGSDDGEMVRFLLSKN